MADASHKITFTAFPSLLINATMCATSQQISPQTENWNEFLIRQCQAHHFMQSEVSEIAAERMTQFQSYPCISWILSIELTIVV